MHPCEGSVTIDDLRAGRSRPRNLYVQQPDNLGLTRFARRAYRVPVGPGRIAETGRMFAFGEVPCFRPEEPRTLELFRVLAAAEWVLVTS